MRDRGPPSNPGPAVPERTHFLARAILMASASFSSFCRPACYCGSCDPVRGPRGRPAQQSVAGPTCVPFSPATPLPCLFWHCTRGSSTSAAPFDLLATTKSLTPGGRHVYHRRDRFSLKVTAGILSSMSEGSCTGKQRPLHPPPLCRPGRADRRGRRQRWIRLAHDPPPHQPPGHHPHSRSRQDHLNPLLQHAAGPAAPISRRRRLLAASAARRSARAAVAYRWAARCPKQCSPPRCPPCGSTGRSLRGESFPRAVAVPEAAGPRWPVRPGVRCRQRPSRGATA